MTYQRVANHRPLARQHTQHARRHARFLADAAQRKRHQRCNLGRLEHHRIAGRQRWREFLRIGGDRRIPWRDRGDHAQRFVHAHRQIIAARRRHRLFERFQACGEIAERTRRAGHQRTRFADRLAVVAPLQLRQRLGALDDQRGDAMQHRGTLMRLQAGPIGTTPGGVRGFHGLGCIACIGGVNLGIHALVSRINAGVACRTPGAPLATHQNVGRKIRQHIVRTHDRSIL